MINKLLTLFTLTSIAISSQVIASPPIPDKKIDSKQWSDESKKLDKKTKTLSEEKSNINSEIKDLKDKLKKQASTIQYNEEKLKTTNKQIRSSEAKILDQKAVLKSQRENIAALVTSLVKMSSIPLDTLMLLPSEQSENLMISYHTLKTLHPQLMKQINELEVLIVKLEKEKANLKRETNKQLKIKNSLKEEKEDIAVLIADRQKDYRKVSKEHRKAQERALYASRNAKNLNELVQVVKDKNEKLQKEQKTAEIKKTYRVTNTKKFPIKGTIITSYGGRDTIGAKSEGVRIQGVDGAIVIAPKSGTVKYAGEFSKYGRIILIEHGKNYHSLIAGLNKIDTVVGQHVSEGEPIAYIGGRTSKKHTVYYELRLNGKPVNPMTHLNKL